MRNLLSDMSEQLGWLNRWVQNHAIIDKYLPVLITYIIIDLYHWC